ncbi:hypothetical protein MBAV_003464 [Candidatus Magnetobacterium bavaricum]|uniref:Uncharacterized protein n=1 Tax=Candidatus Magnetobacterium bavaricum TaxID=29290 RepID=A0A0F3GRF5_9BACT|nr:hypothetical protein MBAV_003464 [Candidatus Magnetobacterium bavaricum]
MYNQPNVNKVRRCQGGFFVPRPQDALLLSFLRGGELLPFFSSGQMRLHWIALLPHRQNLVIIFKIHTMTL